MKIKHLLLCSLLSVQVGYGQAWINEIHYDNVSSDISEFIEVFVEDSFVGSLDDLKISLYNGSDEELYGSNDEFLIGTDFTVGDTVAGQGTIYYLILPANGLQNGPDGIALTNNGSPVQFLSYEGVVGPAGDGDALGETSVVIGVSESSSTPVGASLALTGNGATYENFEWVIDTDDTPGSINNGQSFGTFTAPVASASAVATDDVSIELSFTTNGSDDVLILKNTTGIFTTEPSGDAPAAGNAFADGTVVYEGAVSPQTDTGLTPDVEVFYAFYSVTAANLYSTPIIVSATPNKILFNSEDFSGVSTWVNQTVSGTGDGWDTSPDDAYISGYAESLNENHYLVSPQFDFSTATDLLLEFVYQERFIGPNITILYSSDYTGGDPEANGTWTEIPYAFVDGSTSSTYSGPTQATVSLPASLEGFGSAYLAFKYIADGTSPETDDGVTGSETWVIDDIFVSRSNATLVINPEPSEQASSFSAVSAGISELSLTWTDGAGAQAPAGYLILANQTGTFTDPVDGTPLSTDSDLSDGSGVLNILQGEEMASFTGLPSGTQFFFKAFSYTNAGGNIDYNLTAAATANATTDSDDPEPAAHPTGLSATATDQSIDLSWTDTVDAAGYLILANTTGAFTPPVDGVDPAEDTDLTDGSALIKVDQGIQTASLLGLPDTQYFFTIYPYSNTALNIDFKTDGTPATDDDTTEALPQLIITEIMKNPDAASDNDGEYIEIYNAGSVAVDLQNLTLRDDDTNSHLIASSVIIEPESYAVLGRNTDTAANGQVTVDYAYGTAFTLSNSADEVVLVSANGTSEIDRVVYGGATDFPNPTGSAMIFTGSASDDNNDSSFWATATLREPGFIGSVGDNGSPGFTGSGQQLPGLTFPANVSVVADSATSSIASFEATGGNDTIIVYNTTGVFTDPTGPAPSVDDSFAGGTVLYVGQSSPALHTGLTSRIEVFYAFFTVTSSDEYSPAIQRSVTPGLISFEDFSDSPTWTNQTVAGDDPWDTSAGVAQIDGSDLDPITFEDLDPVTPDNHYLVSPAFDFSENGDIVMEFLYGEAFDGPDIQLVYSTNYSGSGDPEAEGVTWTPITVAFTDGSGVDPSPVNASGPVSLSALDGLPYVRLAFIYTADGTGANSEIWALDDIELYYTTVLEANPLTTYLTDRGLTIADFEDDVNGNGYPVAVEYLAGFGDGSGSDVIEFGIDTDGMLALTLTSDLAEEPEGITVSLLATSDLSVAFAPVSFTHSVIDNLDGTFTHIYAELMPPVVDERFLSLQIVAD